MTTDAILTLTQWMSPGFPVGAFAYSHGLERVIDRGDLLDATTLEQWLRDILEHGSAQSDVILLAESFRSAAPKLDQIDATARAFAASAERLTETVDQGAAFANTVDAVWNTSLGAMTYPVAVGQAARLLKLPLDTTARMYVHAMMANLVSAAVRLVPLGQTEGQAVLARLAPLISKTADRATGLGINDLTSACFAADIAAMHHETQYSKVFRT